MATRITNKDITHVYDIVEEAVGPCKRGGNNALIVGDNEFRVLAGGWHHGPFDKGGCWSRGFLISGGNAHVSPVHDGGRYEGRGWHARMADDIVAKVNNIRGK